MYSKQAASLFSTLTDFFTGTAQGFSGNSERFAHRFTMPARIHYQHPGAKQGMNATRYGDWEYFGRCTDF